MSVQLAASESVLLATSLLGAGVKVPDQVLLLLIVIVGSVPLGLVIVAALKEVTASENSSDTVALSPTLSIVSEIVKEFTVGAVLSTL